MPIHRYGRTRQPHVWVRAPNVRRSDGLHHLTVQTDKPATKLCISTVVCTALIINQYCGGLGAVLRPPAYPPYPRTKKGATHMIDNTYALPVFLRGCGLRQHYGGVVAPVCNAAGSLWRDQATRIGAGARSFSTAPTAASGLRLRASYSRIMCGRRWPRLTRARTDSASCRVRASGCCVSVRRI